MVLPYGMQHEKLITDLCAIVGESNVLVGSKLSNRSAGWNGKIAKAKCLILPASTAEVSEILKLCNKLWQPVVIQGGRTGLVNGATSGSKDVLLSLERMNAIEKIDTDDNVMTVQAGITLQAVQDVSNNHDLMFPVDIGSRGSCTIGGNIATNAGGGSVLRHGMMRNHVLGIEVVLADGMIISSLSKLKKDNTGYDLKHLMIGSEGTLGVVTRAVLQLQNNPTNVEAALIAVDSVGGAIQLLQLLRSSATNELTAFEIMWSDFYTIATADIAANVRPLRQGYCCYVLIQLSSYSDAGLMEAALSRAMEAGCIADAVVAKSQRQAQKLWAVREEVDNLLKVFNPLYGFDVSLPLEAVEQYVQSITSELSNRWPGRVRYAVYGHLGDGNLHILVTANPTDECIKEAIEALVYERLQLVSGSISAEHGVGIDKAKYLSLSRSPEEILMMRRIKQMFDPHNILNPGRIFQHQNNREALLG